jgi:pyruvate,water dikinase
MATPAGYIRWFKALRSADVGLVGGKIASLGELYGNFAAEGIAVPNGFAITTDAYFDALEQADATPRLHRILDGLDTSDPSALASAATAARELIHAATDSAELRFQIKGAYEQLEAELGPEVPVAIRSSAVARDLPAASFAGQHDSFLNIAGEANVFEACRKCFASLFTDRAIAYRTENGVDHFRVGLSVGVMKMVRSDEAISGVVLTHDPETGFKDVVTVAASYGLGDNIVQGKVDPDEFAVHKPTLRLGFRPIVGRSLGGKQYSLGFARLFAGATTRNFRTPELLRSRFCIDDQDVLKLASMAVRIEDHFGAIAGKPTPMDIEWAKDGEDGTIYIVQARPLAVTANHVRSYTETFQLRQKGDVLVTGKPVGEKIASGKARLVDGPAALRAFQPGEVLVARTTSLDWQPVLRQASAIVTDLGGRTCHAAIVARELGIPAVVGAACATEKLKTGDAVTVSCADAEHGSVYAGIIPFDVVREPLGDARATKTEIMVNLSDPASAFRAAMLPSAGVGLARIEFIISEHIGIHPMALIHPEKISSTKERIRIAQMIASAKSGSDFFVLKLAEGVGKIAAAFYPRPVIVRFSDFNANEYAKLLGGAGFETREPNPMIGFRGAARYTHPAYAEAFALECQALHKVRYEMGMTNLRIMVPFCRTVSEAHAVVDALADQGLRAKKNGTPIYMMCEIPNNVIQIDAFAEIFDGLSIGSNDLTQLTLGTDRTSQTIAFDFDERDPGVLEMLRLAVTGAKRRGRHIGICGEAPADYPDVAEYLVKLGIHSISVNPGSVPKIITEVRKAERKLRAKGAEALGRVPVRRPRPPAHRRPTTRETGPRT